MVMATVAAGAAGCIEERTFRPPDPEAPTVPVLRLPQNDAYEGSTVLGRLQPKFVWEPSTGGKGEVRYELQYSADRDFGPGAITVPVSETSHRVAEPLPVSTTPPVGRRYYWRVRACAGETCSEYSRPWWVNLGRSIKDFNGDGYDDTLVGSHTSFNEADLPGRVYVYFGGPGVSFDTTARATLRDFATESWFGVSLDTAGDFDGDGFADVVIGAPKSDNRGTDAGRAYLYRGGAGTTFDSAPDAIFDGEIANASFGISVASAGDVNGDGFSDVIVGASGSPGGGGAYLFFGGVPSPHTVIPDGLLASGPTSLGYGLSVAGVGDVDGDGFGDVVVGSTGYQGSNPAEICSSDLYLGGEGDVFDPELDGTIHGGVGEQCYLRVINAGDFNGDGFSDVVARISNRSEGGRIFLGGKQLPVAPDVVIGLAENHRCLEIASIGDVNGDGAADVAVSDAASTSAVQVAIYLGIPGASRSAVSKTAAARFSKTAALTFFGWSIRGAGDINADGFGDIILGDQGGSNSEGSFTVYYGNAGTSIDEIPNGSVVGGEPGRFLGFSVR